MMKLSEAFEKVEEWSKLGEKVDICVVRYGKLTIDRGGIERGIKPCPFCDAVTGMGIILVVHDDGRAVGYDPGLYHYADAGHPITEEDLDVDLFLSMIANV